MGERGLLSAPRRSFERVVKRVGRALSTIARAAGERWRRGLEAAPRPIERALRVAVGTAKDAGRDRVPRLAAEVAFYALLALPPALLAVVATIGFVMQLLGTDVTREVEQQVIAVARNFLTTSTVNDLVRPTVTNIVRRGDPGVVGIGIVIALWSASRATAVVMEVIRIAHDVEDRRSAIRRRLVALGYTTALVLGLVVILPLLVVGPRVVQLLASPLGLGEEAVAVWGVLYWPGIATLAAAVVATFYYAVVPRSQSWWQELPGAALAIAVWIVGGFALRIYARWTFEEGSLFGPLSSPLVLLLWMYVTGLALLLGVELNAELEHGRASVEEDH